VQQDESTYYTGLAKRCLMTAQLPNSGHNVNLERNAQDWFAVSNSWSQFTLEHSGDGANAPCWAPSGQTGIVFP
jgi:hypothetical protein